MATRSEKAPRTSAKYSTKSPKASRKTVPAHIKAIVWGQAAGRCQFPGCDERLIGDLISGKTHLNKAYIAHIVADSADGPRGDTVLSPKLTHDPANLMLMCDPHHRLIDGPETRQDYSAERLREMKAHHERRIEIVTGIDEDRACHVIRYTAGIAANEAHVAAEHVRSAMLPDLYPADGGWIDLDVVGLNLPDHDPVYWRTHLRNLREMFSQRVRGRLERQEIKRLAVFGVAPMPLLVELGRLLSDIPTADVRQLLRNPKGWRWQDLEPPMSLTVSPAGTTGRTVALKLEISAGIADDRIAQVLGTNAPVWSISASGAHSDIMRRRDDLAEFAKAFRGTLDAIKAAHGEDVTVHLFPAMPVSAAVEVGRAWQPKAHPPIRIYDQNKALGGFVPAHELTHEQRSAA
jgi:hypothetical protein